ncbi:YD repeat-containing protein [Pseudacidovorax sp. 1753]|uniref:LysM peptidoglycan-binding domain-containing protein n=1 Tax=Pseudacidovorax sp. 1753 TaxID=3156419 RepID=UPI0033960744
MYRQPQGIQHSCGVAGFCRADYDALGRQVAVTDANGHTNGQEWDAAGQLVREIHADGGIVQHAYDAFGDEVRRIDALGAPTWYTHDKLGRLIKTTHALVDVYSWQGSNGMSPAYAGQANLTETQRWDQAGRLLSSTNGAGETTRYAYDLRGNLIRTTKPEGQSTQAGYDALNRKVLQADGNGAVSAWGYDGWGRLSGYVDIGRASHSYAYDHAGQLVAQSSSRGQNRVYSYDAAGQLVQINDIALGQTTRYQYDLGGRHLRETTIQGGVTYQDNRIAYDALGRMRWVGDGRITINVDYDAVGNRTHVRTRVNDPAAGADQISDSYNQYDAMNRQTVVDAIDASGNLGTQGHEITYDKNGNRTSDRWWGNQVVTVGGQSQITGYDSNNQAIYSSVPTQYLTTTGYTREEYRYDALGRLASVVRDGVQTDRRLYDGASRVVQSGPAGALPQAYVNALNGVNWSLQTLAGTGSETRINRYNANGQIIHQDVLKSDNLPKYSVEYSPLQTSPVPGMGTAGGYDNAGNLQGYTVFDWTSLNITNYSNTYSRAEGYRQLTSFASSTLTQPGLTSWSYGNAGELSGITDAMAPMNNRTFVSDMQGNILYSNQGGQEQYQLVVNGQVLGRYGKVRDANNPTLPGGVPLFNVQADFNFGYQPIDGNYPSSSPGTYAVGAGDTLQSIARGAYGDQSLWYLIADANDLSGNGDLKSGQVLTIPSRVGSSNSASSFKPYDPTKVIGDTTPTPMAMPQGNGGGGCGGLGQIIVAVVVVVVAFVTQQYYLATYCTSIGTTAAGATIYSTGSTIAAGAIGGASGSIAGQAVGVAIGAQERFSWKGVALGAISGGVSAGVGGLVPQTTNSFVNGVVAGAVRNTVTQGIAVATGLQKSFDWKGVAASALSGGIAQGLNDVMGYNPRIDQFNLGKSLISGISSSVVANAARGGRLSGTSIAADAFGNVIGDALAGAMGQSSAKDDLDAFLKLNDNFSGVDASGGALLVNGRTFSQDMAMRKAQNDPYGLSGVGYDGDDGLGIGDIADGAAVRAGRRSIDPRRVLALVDARLSTRVRGETPDDIRSGFNDSIRDLADPRFASGLRGSYVLTPGQAASVDAVQQQYGSIRWDDESRYRRDLSAFADGYRGLDDDIVRLHALTNLAQSQNPGYAINDDVSIGRMPTLLGRDTSLLGLPSRLYGGLQAIVNGPAGYGDDGGALYLNPRTHTYQGQEEIAFEAAAVGMTPTPGPRGAGVARSGFAVGGTSSEKLATTLARIEAESLRLPGAGDELLTVISPSTGEVLGQVLQSGSRGRPSESFLRAMDDAVFTHNHPSGASLGTEDVATALAYGARQVRAVGDKNTYVLDINLPSSTQSPARMNFASEVTVAQASIQQGVIDGTPGFFSLPKTERISAFSSALSEYWTNLSSRYPEAFKFTVTPTKPSKP